MQTAPIRPLSLLRLLGSPTRRVREQADNEDRARLIAHFAALEHAQRDAALELMWRQLLPLRLVSHSERSWTP